MMRRMLVGMGSLLLAALAQAQDPQRVERVQSLLPEVDRIYAELAEKEHVPGLVYGVVLDGKLIHARGLGLANIGDKLAAGPGTLFRVASMSKSFVALAALKLRDEGKLRLDDPVSKYLPEMRAVRLPTSDSPPVTIGMLMTMSTGLPEDNPWGDRQMALSHAALEKMVRGGLSFSTAPATAYEYSNLGYIMLGRIVGKVSGMRFQDYVTRKILLPLGMTSTRWEYAGTPKERLALGYLWTGKEWELEPMLHDGDGAAMGGLISTIDDYARYVAFHLEAWPARDGADTGPVKRATVREMHQPKTFGAMTPGDPKVDGATPNPQVSFYGYGMRWLSDSRKLVTVGHSGGLPGFGSQFRFAPGHGIGVIAFGNARYAPVQKPTAQILAMLVEKGGLERHPVAPSAILTMRHRQVAQLVQGWDEALGREIVADNFFLDRSRQDWMARSGEALAKIGKIVQVGELKPENALRGTFPLVGERGSVNVFFTLTPEKIPKLQELELQPVK